MTVQYRKFRSSKRSIRGTPKFQPLPGEQPKNTPFKEKKQLKIGFYKTFTIFFDQQTYVTLRLGFIFVYKFLQFGGFVGFQIAQGLKMLLGQIKSSHFDIRLSDILMGFGQIRL